VGAIVGSADGSEVGSFIGEPVGEGVGFMVGLAMTLLIGSDRTGLSAKEEPGDEGEDAVSSGKFGFSRAESSTG